MLRLGVTERAITELVAIGEHVVGLSVSAAGFRLDPDQLVAPAERASASDASATEFEDEVIAWARENLGLDDIPSYWLLLRDEPKFRAAHWHKHRLILGDGELEAKAKALIAYAVACYRTSSYWIAYFDHYCRTAFGATDKELREAVLAAMHSASSNTVAHGMMLQARHTDMRAEDFHGQP